MSITIQTRQKNSWTVSYSGKFGPNSRGKHVELKGHMDSVKQGVTFTLSNLHTEGKAYMWDVDGLKNGTHTAHFTVAFDSSKPLTDYE